MSHACGEKFSGAASGIATLQRVNKLVGLAGPYLCEKLVAPNPPGFFDGFLGALDQVKPGFLGGGLELVDVWHLVVGEGGGCGSNLLQHLQNAGNRSVLE